MGITGGDNYGDAGRRRQEFVMDMFVLPPGAGDCAWAVCAGPTSPPMISPRYHRDGTWRSFLPWASAFPAARIEQYAVQTGATGSAPR